MPLSFLDTLQSSVARHRSKRRRWLNLSLAILMAAVAGLIFGALSLSSAMAEVEQSTAERAKFNGWLRDLLGVNILLTDAETGQRGYLLTGKNEYLLPYVLAVRALPLGIEESLRVLPVDSEQRHRIEQLQPLIEAKLAELRETIELYKAGKHAAALTMVNSDVGREYMEKIRALLTQAVADLRAERDAAESQVLVSTQATKRWALITVTALVLALILTGFQLRRMARSRDAYETELARKTAILNIVVDEIPSMMAVWDKNLVYRLVNKSFEAWRNTTRRDVIGKTMEEVVGREEYERSLPWLKRALNGERVRFEKDYKEGKVKHVLATYSPLMNEDGAILGIVALAHDITDHQKEKKRLQHLSETDSLTGLLNRLGFESYLENQVEAGRSDSIALIYLDLDNFKPVNDTYGHAAGDAVLQIVADRLRHSVRPTDAVARLGGDEFAVVLPDIRLLSDAERIADKIAEEIRRPIEWEKHTLLIRASMGTAFDVRRYGGWRALMAHADSIVYAAKSDRRGPSENSATSA